MNKYRLGRKQNRVILDENGYEVAQFNKKHTMEAKLCVELMNKFFNGEPVKLCEVCLLKTQHDDMKSANWKYCSECGEKL